jgi:hypothetical protein
LKEVTSETRPTEQTNDVHIDIPMTLDEVRADTQFVGSEHLHEFWQTYRKQPAEKASYVNNRHIATDSALRELVFFRPRRLSRRGSRGVPAPDDSALRLKLRNEAGLVVFYRHIDVDKHTNSISNKELTNYDTPVIQIRGLTNYIRSYGSLPHSEQLPDLQPAGHRFMRAFTQRLQTQIETANGQHRLFE